MSSSTTKLSSPFSSPNSAALLKRSIIAWSLETGLPASIHVRAGGKIFNLWSRSVDTSTKHCSIRPMLNCQRTFRGVLKPLKSLHSSATILRSLSTLLMLYINQVVLQSWDDTLIVLRKCQSLLPWAEELLIVSRCVESLAFMACMEILDPENNMVSQDMWIKDLVALPFEFFKRIIASLRRQGMKEKYVSPLIVFYANKWVLSKKTDDVNDIVSEILQGILELLPMGEESSKTIPTSFYFSLFSRSMTLNLSDEGMMKLHDHVASLLHLAQVEDFLLPL